MTNYRGDLTVLTDYEKGAVLLAIAAAAETVRAVVPVPWNTARVYVAYRREDVLMQGLPEYVENFGSRLRDEGQYGY